MSTTLYLKANSRGSWATVLPLEPHASAEVKAACKVLLKAAAHRVSFKITDALGVTLSSLDARQPDPDWADRE